MKIRRHMFGDDAVLPRRMVVDAAYSFNVPQPWACVPHDLRPRLNRRAMEQLFARLPEEVRSCYEALARQSQDRTTLLLLAPCDSYIEFQDERWTRAVVKLACRIAEIESSTSLLKPHPLNSDAQLDGIMARIANALPRTPLLAIREHRESSVEIVLAPFAIRACGAFGSSSLRTLKRLRATARSLLAICAHLPYGPDMIKRWIDDDRKDYSRSDFYIIVHGASCG